MDYINGSNDGTYCFGDNFSKVITVNCNGVQIKKKLDVLPN